MAAVADCWIQVDVSDMDALIGTPVDINIPGTLSPLRFGIIKTAVRDEDAIQLTMRDGKMLRIESRKELADVSSSDS